MFACFDLCFYTAAHCTITESSLFLDRDIIAVAHFMRFSIFSGKSLINTLRITLQDTNIGPV